MNEAPKQLLYYQTLTGKCPFETWLEKLKDRRAAAAIRSRLNSLMTYGHVGDSRSVGNGVHEFRIHLGPGYRAYFAYVGETIILLLCGGAKNNQQRDIELAKNYLEDYKQRI